MASKFLRVLLFYCAVTQHSDQNHSIQAKTTNTSGNVANKLLQQYQMKQTWLHYGFPMRARKCKDV